VVQGFTCELGPVVLKDTAMAPMRVNSLSMAVLIQFEDAGCQVGVIAFQVDGYIEASAFQVRVIEVVDE